MRKKPVASFAFLVAFAAAGYAASPNHPTGTAGLLMVDKVGGHVRFFDPVTLAERTAIAVPKNPHDFALSVDHRFAYVPIYGPGVYGRNPDPGHELYVFDLSSQRIARVIDLSPYKSAHSLQVDSNGMLYVTAELDRKLLIVDPQAGRVIDTIDTEGSGHWVALLPDASKAYVANKNDRPFVSVLDIAKRELVARVPMPNGTQGVAASPDGKTVVAMDFAAPEMAVIDTATDTVVERIVLEGRTGGAYKAFFSPDGRWLLTLAGSTLGVFDARDLGVPQRVLTVGSFPMGFAFSSDGKTAIVGNHDDGTVSVIDLEHAQITKTVPAGDGVETLTFF
jgi:DNA-binding beta-propeller fold protein YncE